MATLRQVQAKARKVGAWIEQETEDTFCLLLPDHLEFEGYGGAIPQEKDPDESWSKYWDEFMSVLDSPVKKI